MFRALCSFFSPGNFVLALYFADVADSAKIFYVLSAVQQEGRQVRVQQRLP
jgi:hypothetical protein